MDETESPQIEPKRRWFPRVRFSLRTLLLTVLLIESGATLWWNWGPWRVVWSIHEHRILSWNASEKLLCLKVWSSSNYSSVRFVFYDKTSGLKCLPELAECYPWPSAQAAISKNSRYIVFHAPYQKNALLYDSVTKRLTPFPKDNDNPDAVDDAACSFFCNDTWLYVSGSGHTLLHLPDLTPRDFQLSAADPRALSEICGDEHWLIARCGNRVFAYRDEGNTLTRQWELPEGAGTMRVFGDMLAWEARSSIHVYATLSGQLVANLPATPPFEFGFGSMSGEHYVACDNMLNGVTLWQLKPEVKVLKSYANGRRIFYFVGDRLTTQVPLALYSTATGEPLWSEGDYGYFSQDGQIAYMHQGTSDSIVDGYSGAQLFDLSSLHWKKETRVSLEFLQFQNDCTSFVTYANTLETPPQPKIRDISARIAMWKLTRPYQWHGVTWLPEFWLTLILVAAFIWSVLRDWRTV